VTSTTTPLATSSALAEPTRRSLGRATRDIVLFSLSVTALAALAALAVAFIGDTRWSLAFVVIRWSIVAVLLATPLAHQIAIRWGVGFRMPWAMRTPATALLLTTESIMFDIISAQLARH